MEDWQPIDTAPRDGTPIDLWSRDLGGFRFRPAGWLPPHDDGEPCWCWIDKQGRNQRIEVEVHEWKPLRKGES